MFESTFITGNNYWWRPTDTTAMQICKPIFAYDRYMVLSVYVGQESAAQKMVNAWLQQFRRTVLQAYSQWLQVDGFATRER